MSLENIYTFCQFLHSFRKFRRTNAKEKIKSSENYLVGFLLQHIHDKTIIVEDIKNTITLKKKKKEKTARKRLFSCIRNGFLVVYCLNLNGLSVRAFCMLKTHAQQQTTNNKHFVKQRSKSIWPLNSMLNLKSTFILIAS